MNSEKQEICGENFCGSLGDTNYELVWPPIFAEKSFSDSPKTINFAKVFSLESFLLYGKYIESDFHLPSVSVAEVEALLSRAKSSTNS